MLEELISMNCKHNMCVNLYMLVWDYVYIIYVYVTFVYYMLILYVYTIHYIMYDIFVYSILYSTVHAVKVYCTVYKIFTVQQAAFYCTVDSLHSH